MRGAFFSALSRAMLLAIWLYGLRKTIGVHCEWSLSNSGVKRLTMIKFQHINIARKVC